MAPASPFARRPLTLLFTAVCAGSQLFAQTPSTPAPAAKPATPAAKPKPTPPPVLGPDGVKLIPQPGIAISDGDRAELQAGVTALGKDLTVLKHSLKDKPELLALLPDVMIFHKAVDWALRYNEFYNAKQVGTAKGLLEMGNQRLAELKAGTHSWTTATGLVPRGYLSKIDGSVQPYGMVVPEDWKADDKTPRRLDFWAHGRGETLTELDFINQRLTSKGEFNPPGVFTLHLYGRYCCANKFAGEVDLFEALDSARQSYPIDSNKLVIRGFSMGGGATWQFGTHFAGLWAAVQPGAGFGETKEFMRLGTTPDKPLPPEWEQKLWRWYDSTGYVNNLANTTTVAYSGEIDGQKQAADIMIRSARSETGWNATMPASDEIIAKADGSSPFAEAQVTGLAPGLVMYHIIAPQTPHKVKPELKPEIDAAVAAAVENNRGDLPKKVSLTTYTLRYNRMKWLTINSLEKSWDRSQVDAEISDKGSLQVTTKNVTGFTLTWPSNRVPFARANPPKAVVDGQELSPPGDTSNATVVFRFQKSAGKWTVSGGFPETSMGMGMPKRHEISGPIDDAFMSSFVNVRPTGKPLNDKVGAWATSELDHALGFWRKVYRGEAPVKDDTAVNDADIKNSNLVLWGDPSSNAVLKKIADKLPVKWDAKQLVFAGQTYDATHTAPVLIFPNPLNPWKYIVLNSGVTFREQALLNNADQTPKLPDWAIIDLNTPPGPKWPGEVKAAGFFDEQWQAPQK